ncbi:MAG: cytosine permease, partial [Clostridia bacterium]
DWEYRKILTGWLAVVLIMTFSEKIWECYSTFVSVGGCIYAPAIAIFLADFFILRKQKFSLRSAYMLEDGYAYSNGFNLVTIIAFVVGIVVYFALFNPVTYEANSPLFFYLTGTGASFLASGLSYILLSKIPPLSRYLKID